MDGDIIGSSSAPTMAGRCAAALARAPAAVISARCCVAMRTTSAKRKGTGKSCAQIGTQSAMLAIAASHRETARSLRLFTRLRGDLPVQSSKGFIFLFRFLV